MNQAKFEKIDGREALKRLLDGEEVFMELINETVKLKLAEDGLRCDAAGYENQVTYWTFNQIYTNGGLYVPKPFDVRQAMRDRPNEWVGVFKENGDYYKIGFDNESYQAVHTLVCNVVKPNYELRNVYPCEKEHFDKSIPIEDVPEEATR